MVFYSEKKKTSLKYKKILRPNDIVPSVVPPPSGRPTRLLCIPPPIAPLALPIAARAALRVLFSAGGAKSMMLSAHAESIILSAPPAESMMLSA